MFDPTADIIFADGPASNPNQPQKVLLRKYFRQFEDAIGAGLSNGGLIYDTKANMNADLAHPANSSAWVVADSAAANNGIYRKSGASGSGSWVRIADLPYSVVYVQNAGLGTANAVVATSSLAVVSVPFSQLISIPFTVSNTGAMTISINGETPRSLVTNTGEPIPAGYVATGMSALVQIDNDGNYRLFSYGDASAIQAVVEALVVEAKAARDDAMSAQPQAFPVSRSGLAGLPDTTANAYLKETGFEGYFKQVTAADYTDLIAADTAGGEIKVSAGNPSLAYLRQRKNGDYFKSSEAGGDLAVALALAAERVALGDVSKAVVEINEIGTKVMASGLIVPDKVELIGLGSDKSSLNFDNVSSGDLAVLAGVATNCGLVVAGGGLTDLGLGFDDIDIDDVSINFASASPLKPGDILSLYRPADYSFGLWNGTAWTGYRSYYRAGQRIRVVSVEGTRVWLDDRIRMTYRSSGQYATTIYKQARRGGRLGGFSLDASGSTVDQTNLAYFYQLDAAEVDDLRVIGTTYCGVVFQQCFDMVPRRIHANTQVRSDFGPTPPTTSGNDYPILIANCTRVKVKESVGTGNWSGADFGGGSQVGGSVNIDCGYEDCVLTSNYSLAGGMHGNTVNCGFHRCTINGPVTASGKAPYITDCDVRLVDHASNIAVYFAELKGGVCDLTGTKIYSSKNAGSSSRACIDINTGGGNDTYMDEELFVVGKISLNAPNETRPVDSYQQTSGVKISIDLEFSYLNTPNAASRIVYSRQNSSGTFSPSTRHRVIADNVPSGIAFATFTSGYSAKKYEYPSQSVDITWTLAATSVIESSAVSWPNPYPVAPGASFSSMPRVGTSMAIINTSPSYPGANSMRAILALAGGGNLPSTGTYTAKATAFF